MKISHTKEIRRVDGTRVHIKVTLEPSELGVYKFAVQTCAPGRNKWASVFDPFDAEYLALPRAERYQYVTAATLKVVTKEELNGAATELWRGLKP